MVFPSFQYHSDTKHMLQVLVAKPTSK